MPITSSQTRTTEPLWFEREGGEAHALDGKSGTDRKFEGGLRFAVGAVDRQLSLLAAQETEGNASAMGDLLSRWAVLVDRLALGPTPDVRSCPACGRVGMSAATLCGFCWTRLSPIAPGAAPTVAG